MTRAVWTWRAMAVVACLGLATPAALAQGSPAQEEQLPQSIREAYQRAEEFGATPTPAAPAPPPASKPPGPNLWRDPIHYLGLGAGALAVLALLVGLYLLFVVSRYRGPDRIRRRWRVRYVHMFLGATAVGLGVGHSLLRFYQLGGVRWVPPPMLALIAFAVVALTGVLRAYPPRAWARYPWVFIWGHRAALALALYMLTRHVIGAYHFFGKGG